VSVENHYAENLALTQLETALRLYFEGKDFASVITLAGAADEIFGQLLRASGRPNSLDNITKAIAAISNRLFGEVAVSKETVERANLARNKLKHWNAGESLVVKLDLEEEARDMLNRAIDNYFAL
jgi:hypothetical protein